MECLFVYEGHTSKINRLLVAGRFIFSTSFDKLAKVWYMDITIPERYTYDEVKDKACIRILKGHTKSVYPISFIPAENNPQKYPEIFERDLVITGSVDCTIRIWSLKYSECLKILYDHKGPIHSILLNPIDNLQILSSGGDGLIICWDVITGEKIREMRGHQTAVVCTIAHKRMLYSGSSDGNTRSWAIEFGDCTRNFQAHISGITCIQYYNGIGHANGVVNLFDSKSGTLKKCFIGHKEAISGLQVCPNKIFTSCMNGKVCVWNLSGFVDEVFSKYNNNKKEDSSDEDCDKVKDAIKIINNYIKHQ